jgi:aspartyl protease family protein
MDRKFALWLGAPVFVATVCLALAAYFTPKLFSDGVFLAIACSVIGVGLVVGTIHALLSINAGNASPWMVLHPSVLLTFAAILGLAGDAWGIRSVLWHHATMSRLESEGIRFARADDGQFRPRVSIDGNILQVVIDPEAEHILLSQADATRIGVDLSAVTFDVPVDGPARPQPAAAIVLKKIQLLNVTVTDVPAFVPEPDLAVSVLGRAFLDRTRDWGVEGDTLMVLP